MRAALTAGGTVTCACDGTIALGSEILIGNEGVIDATGHEVTLSGGGSSRLFNISPGASLKLIHLSLRDGLAAGTNGFPGSDGEAGFGGAVLNRSGSLTAIDCSFVNNLARGGRGGDGTTPSPLASGTGGPAAGGAVFNEGGQVYLTNTLFQGNTAAGGRGGDSHWISSGGNGGSAGGGALFCQGGMAFADHCQFNASQSLPGSGGSGYLAGQYGDTAGGAIFSTNTLLRLAGSVLASNTCPGGSFGGQAAGGAVWQGGGLIEATDSLFQMNSAVGGAEASQRTIVSPAGDGRGGALWLGSATATVSACSFFDNLAAGGTGGGLSPHPGTGRGGAIYTSTGLAMVNTTLCGNVARFGSSAQPGSGLGGGLCNEGGAVVLTHVTALSNAAEIAIPGGTNLFRGAGVESVTGSTMLRNSILAFSRVGTNAVGAIADGGGNISSDLTPGFTQPDSRNALDPLLGSPGYYGGTTPTVPLLAGSPAIDAANSNWCAVVDQRGYPRPFGSGCDSGAFEWWPPNSIFGRIRGYMGSPGGLTVSAGGHSTGVASNGVYALAGLPAGMAVVTPVGSDTVAVPAVRSVTVPPDATGVDFQAYRSNGLTITPVAGDTLRVGFAGATGLTCRVMVSSNLPAWLPVLTNATSVDGLFDLLVPNQGAAGGRFFKVIAP